MPGKYLTLEQRLYIVDCMENGDKLDAVTKSFKKHFGRKVHRSTVYKIHKKYLETGSVEDKEKSGRPEAYDERGKRNIARAALTNPEKSINDLSKDYNINTEHASRSTIQSIILAADIISRVIPSLYTGMTKRHLVQRMTFARRHENWTNIEWQLIVFSDESDLFPSKSGRRYYRVKRSDNPSPTSLCKNVRSNITIKVWGAISCHGVGPLIRYTGTMRKEKYTAMLEAHLENEYPFLFGALWFGEEGGQFIFMDDNASCHRSAMVKKWKEENGLVSFTWPSHSPDLNIIEHLWSYLKNELYEISDTLHSPEDTWRETQRLWNAIQPGTIEKLYRSLSTRVKKVIEKRGGPTGY